MLLSMTCGAFGRDKNGLLYSSGALAMCRRLNLLDEIDGLTSLRPLDLEDEDVKAAACAVAWSAFNWHTLVSA
jgi:hypothetical protein